MVEHAGQSHQLQLDVIERALGERKKDIPPNDQRLSQYSRLEGTVVLLDSRSGSRIITAYRNRSKHALKAIRWKAKYDRKA